MEIIYNQNFKFHQMIYLMKKQPFIKDTAEYKQKKINYKKDKIERNRLMLLNEPANNI